MLIMVDNVTDILIITLFRFIWTRTVFVVCWEFKFCCFVEVGWGASGRPFQWIAHTHKIGADSSPSSPVLWSYASPWSPWSPSSPSSPSPSAGNPAPQAQAGLLAHASQRGFSTGARQRYLLFGSFLNALGGFSRNSCIFSGLGLIHTSGGHYKRS